MSSKSSLRINQSIRATQVRLIDTDGSQLGIKPVTEALLAARAKGLDLVEIAPLANPPVCKILDYDKYLYEKERQDREARKKQRAGLLKEVRLSPVIGSHDLDVKLKHAESFLKAHDKVRVTVVFRGRQNQHKDLGMNLLKQVQERLNAVANVEQNPFLDRNRLHMMLIPKH
ncbi:MAG: translation initiation factor IF-3 [Elusimicrobia bacterium]|nr:translation initiation factor IF-3 [Elusimicrobiota bacterium]